MVFRYHFSKINNHAMTCNNFNLLPYILTLPKFSSVSVLEFLCYAIIEEFMNCIWITEVEFFLPQSSTKEMLISKNLSTVVCIL